MIPLSLLLPHSAFVLNFASVCLHAPLEDNIGWIVSKLRVLVNAVNVHSIVAFNITILKNFLLLILAPIHTSLSAARNNLLLTLPRSINSALVSVLENSSPLRHRIDAIFDDHNCVRAVKSKLFSVLVSMLVDVVRCDVEHAAKSTQFVGVVTKFHHVVLHEIEDVLIVDVEVEIEEVRAVKHRRHDVLNDAV